MRVLWSAWWCPDSCGPCSSSYDPTWWMIIQPRTLWLRREADWRRNTCPWKAVHRCCGPCCLHNRLLTGNRQGNCISMVMLGWQHLRRLGSQSFVGMIYTDEVIAIPRWIRSEMGMLGESLPEGAISCQRIWAQLLTDACGRALVKDNGASRVRTSVSHRRSPPQK